MELYAKRILCRVLDISRDDTDDDDGDDLHRHSNFEKAKLNNNRANKSEQQPANSNQPCRKVKEVLTRAMTLGGSAARHGC